MRLRLVYTCLLRVCILRTSHLVQTSSELQASGRPVLRINAVCVPVGQGDGLHGVLSAVVHSVRARLMVIYIYKYNIYVKLCYTLIPYIENVFFFCIKRYYKRYNKYCDV